MVEVSGQGNYCGHKTFLETVPLKLNISEPQFPHLLNSKYPWVAKRTEWNHVFKVSANRKQSSHEEKK